MKHFILFIFSITFPFVLFCQNNDKIIIKDTIYLGLTAYPFSYNMMMKEGSVAIGPSLFLNSDRLTIQISLLEDVKKYITYEKIQLNQYKEVKNNNLFFPIMLHYSYFKRKNMNLFLTTGFILGGRFYLDEYHSAQSTNGINFLGGTGFCLKLSKSLNLRANAIVRYSEKKFFPGLSVDFLIPIYINLKKQ